MSDDDDDDFLGDIYNDAADDAVKAVDHAELTENLSKVSLTRTSFGCALGSCFTGQAYRDGVLSQRHHLV